MNFGSRVSRKNEKHLQASPRDGPQGPSEAPRLGPTLLAATWLDLCSEQKESVGASPSPPAPSRLPSGPLRKSVKRTNPSPEAVQQRRGTSRICRLPGKQGTRSDGL